MRRPVGELVPQLDRRIPRSTRPPPFYSNPYVRRRFRFNVAVTGRYNISPDNVGKALGMKMMTTTTSSSINTAYRIRSIEVWGAVVAGTASEVSVTWFGDQSLNFESNREVSDSSTSTAYTPYVRATPPPRSSAAMWRGVDGATWGTDVMFSVQGSLGSIIDIEVDMIQCDGDASPAASHTIAGGTAGKTVYFPLDGYGAGDLPPVGVTAP